MRLFLAVISGIMLFACPGLAQEENMTTVTSSLQSVLLHLKESVNKMALDNDRLAARDNAIKKQIDQLQMQLGRVKAQGDLLNKAADKLKEDNPGRARQITDLKEKELDLDQRIQKNQGAIELIQQSLSARDAQSKSGFHRQKEKLTLMKMIDESQQRQQVLQGSILEFVNNVPVLPVSPALARQQLLKEQINALNKQIALYPPQKPSSKLPAVDPSEDARVRELQAQLKPLEENYSRLKDLMAQMNQKAQNSLMTAGGRAEERKLQGSLDDLNRQRVELMADLADLRSQMIDLDKRKLVLEDRIQP